MKKYLSFIYILFLLYHCPLEAQVEGNWKPTGPILFPTNASGQIHGIGRITQMKFHPTNPQKIYAVSASGGLWISSDEAQTWKKTGTDNLPRTACASICIDFTNDQVIYLGTGDPNYYYQTFGIWKSIDGGATWSPSNTGIGNRLAVEIFMDPTNENVLIAATNDGIWKSTDAGATWTVKKVAGDFKDMIFKPATNSATIYAATSTQFFRSLDMGETWELIALPGTGHLNGGRIAVSEAAPETVYLTFVGNFAAGTATPVLKSTDSGATFTVVKPAGVPNLNGYNENEGGQGNYNYCVIADPTNANTLYVSGHCIWKSVNGGANWTRLTNWWEKVHTDMHDFEFSPEDPTKLYNINDGGVWLSTSGGVNWTPKSDGLESTECYQSAQSPLRRDMNYIGTQDNGELYFSNDAWFTNRGGDWNCNMEMDFQNSTMVYYTQNGRRRSFSQSEQEWAIPVATGNDVELEFTPLNSNLGFVSKTDVWRTTNLSTNPPTWTKLTDISTPVKAIESSPADANILYVVTNDARVLRSDNALSDSPTFTTLAAPAPTSARASISGIKSNPDVVYISCGSKVFRSEDKGETWADITGSLPTINIIKIHQDPNRTDESIYVGMATGVYYRNNTMSNWLNFSKNLPTVANITDFMMYDDGTTNSILRVSYYGRGVWESPLNFNPDVLRAADNPQLTIQGLDYKYYEGSWKNLPNFDNLKPLKSGIASNFDISLRSRELKYGFKFSGYVEVPSDGQYTFYARTDDGSKLFIGDKMIVDNDGVHAAREKSGTIGLKAGKHAITLIYFQGGGGQACQISYSGPGIEKKVIPATSLFTIPAAVACEGTGTISREQWNNVSGNSVSNIPVNSAPSEVGKITVFEGPTNTAESYGSRIRGYVCPPYTGQYTFWIASDDHSELWLSTSDSPSQKVKIAYLENAVPERAWDASFSQKSLPIQLNEGQKYYIEALHKEGGGGDHLAVGWQLPTGANERPIPGNRLYPFDAIINTAPSVSITSPTSSSTFPAPVDVLIEVEAKDNEGGISKVEFFSGLKKLGEDLSSPYSFNWQNVSAGNYVITAKATDVDGATATSTAVKFAVTGTTLRNPENPENTIAGIEYDYYEGSWTALPDFNQLTPVKSGDLANFDLSPRIISDEFAFKFKGYIEIPEDGEYTFYTSSDDGSRLWIGDDHVLVVDNDGLHGSTEAFGTIGLKAGKHTILVTYFELGADEVLDVSYSSEAISKQIIPDSVLFRLAEPIASKPITENFARIKGESGEGKSSLVNSPNPYHADTNIEFELRESGDVLLFISDYQGRKIKDIYKGYLKSGKHSFKYHSPDLASGNYICKMISRNQEESIILLKVSKPRKLK